MPRRRLFSRAGLSAGAMLLGLVSMAAAQQDPFDSAATSTASGPSATEAAGVKGRTAAPKPAEKKPAKKAEPEFVQKSLQEWQRTLPRGVFEVTRLKATEPPFSGRYATGHFEGTFHCACCDAALFSSKAKFDSGTGWPSFWQPVQARAIDRAIDNSEAEPRIEVMCHRCGAHLGHVFDDAIGTPTGLRYCINSLSLKLESPQGVSARPSSTRARSRVRTTRSRSTTRRPPAGETSKANGSGSPSQPGDETPAAGKTGGSE